MRFRRVLIANRGEIAVRIIRTLNKLNIESVAIYHHDELGSLHVDIAKHAVNLGKGNLKDTYLNIDKIIGVAKQFDCDAIHPGYGFLSENYRFAEACEQNHIKFIGPTSDVIRAMGSKLEAKKLAIDSGVPVLGNTETDITKLSQFEIKFPILIKAAAGGGGKGMRVVRDYAGLSKAVEQAKREAYSYFGDDKLIIEPYLENARHIEVQILADEFGNVIHLFERECSIQRNNQKIIEEAPAVSIHSELKEKLYATSIKFAKDVGYTNAGTIEYLVDGNDFYFLEMNTRIQVEHPVTEEITGIDLIEQQIRIAEGNKLTEKVLMLKPKGHAMEVRLYAEKPFDSFMPSAGTLAYIHSPSEIRFDTFTKVGSEITPHFDAMIGKLVVVAENREACIVKMQRTLENTQIHGIQTNKNFLQIVVANNDFRINNISTNFIKNNMSVLNKSFLEQKPKTNFAAILAAFISRRFFKVNSKNKHEFLMQYLLRNIRVDLSGVDYNVVVKLFDRNKFTWQLGDKTYETTIVYSELNRLRIEQNGINYEFTVSTGIGGNTDFIEFDGEVYELRSPLIRNMSINFINKNQRSINKGQREVISPLYGTVIELKVKKGDYVKKGDVLVTIESMKSENQITAPSEGKLDKIFVQEGTQVKENMKLLIINPILTYERFN